MAALPTTRLMQLGNGTRKALSVRCQSQVGDKVLPMLRGPADILFLAPRIALGALLSTSNNLERLPQDLEKLSTLVTDPRPLEQKQTELLLELEDRVASFIERGLEVENGIISTVNEVLPEEVKSQLPEEVRNLVLTPRPIPSAESTDDWTTAPAPGYGANDGMATWTISSVDEGDGMNWGPSGGAGSGGARMESSDEPPASAATVAASQAAAELVEIQSAVMFVKDQLAALQNNTDASKTSMLKLNLREAAQSLDRKLEQRAGAAGADPAVANSIDEASALLSEVQALL